MAHAATRTADEEQLLARLTAAPMAPVSLFTREGWNTYARSVLVPPDLTDTTPSGPDVPDDDARLAYHGHLRMVRTAFLEDCLLKAARTFHVNGHRHEGLLDMVIDGPAGTGKTLLLRAIGRAFQQRVEQHYRDRIPVVHIPVPDESEHKTHWVWEIASFLGLAPEPKTEEEAFQLRRHPDLTIAVNTVLARRQTRMLLIDDIQRTDVTQLAQILHYFDYLRTRMNIATIFCGTGACDLLNAARAQADRRDVALVGATRRQMPGASKAQLTEAVHQQRALRSLLPVTWVDPIPYTPEKQEAWMTVLKGFEQDLRLHHLEPHALTQHAPYLHHRTSGYLLHLSHLICQAATHAITTGTENITRDTLDTIHIGREETIPHH